MPSNDLPPPVVERSLSEFDLAQLRGNPLDISEAIGTAPCVPSSSGEIVVCGRGNRYYRLRPLSNNIAPPDDPLRAGIQLGNGSRLDIHGDAASLAGGAQSNRMMLTFGHKF